MDRRVAYYKAHDMFVSSMDIMKSIYESVCEKHYVSHYYYIIECLFIFMCTYTYSLLTLFNINVKRRNPKILALLILLFRISLWKGTAYWLNALTWYIQVVPWLWNTERKYFKYCKYDILLHGRKLILCCMYGIIKIQDVFIFTFDQFDPQPKLATF